MRQKQPTQENFLKFVPSQAVSFEDAGNGLVVLLRPKFMSGVFAKILQPRLKKKFFRVKLDELGTATWRAIDGKRNLAQIADRIFDEFGDAVEPRYERVSRFMGSLFRGNMITLSPSGPASTENSHGAG